MNCNLAYSLPRNTDVEPVDWPAFVKPDRDCTDAMVVDALATHGPMSVRSIKKVTGLSGYVVQNAVRRLLPRLQYVPTSRCRYRYALRRES